MGDLIIEDQKLGIELLNSHAIPIRPVELGDTNQIYCIYLNNLTTNMADSITAGLERYEAFCGYADTSTWSPMKDWLSLTLVDGYLKHKGGVLNGHEDDVGDEEDLNVKGWPWDEHGYVVRSLRDMYFHLFLGYKIERRVLPAAEGDTRFALIAISGQTVPLTDLRVEVAEAKGEYLRAGHGASLARAGLADMTDQKLAETIKAKIDGSYIYYLRYLRESDTSLFNIMLEVRDQREDKVTRLVASLEYRPAERLLRLVTLY